MTLSLRVEGLSDGDAFTSTLPKTHTQRARAHSDDMYSSFLLFNLKIMLTTATPCTRPCPRYQPGLQIVVDEKIVAVALEAVPVVDHYLRAGTYDPPDARLWARGCAGEEGAKRA